MTPRQIAAVAAAVVGIAAILAAVGGPAAWASYHHAYTVFVTFGEVEGRAAWLPLTTDGMLAAALVVMYARRWGRQPVGFVPWLAFAVGLTGTLAANLASANAFGAPTVGEGIGRLAVAVWPPIVFAVTLELVAVMLGRLRDYVARRRVESVDTWPATWLVGIPEYPYRPPVEEAAPASAPHPVAPPAPVLPVELWERAALPTRPRRTRPERPAGAPVRPVPGAPGAATPGTNGKPVRWTDADEVIRMELQGEIDEGAPVPSVRGLKTRYSMSQDRASKIRARLTAGTESVQ